MIKRLRYRRPNLEKFTGLVVYNPKHSLNVGTLYRTAVTLGNVSFIGTIGYKYEEPHSDTIKACRHLPYFFYESPADFYKHIPKYTNVVAVEMHKKSVPLPDFNPPDRCIYLLGGETLGLPPEMLKRFQKKVMIPSQLDVSLNLSVAGSLVLYHDFLKKGSYCGN